MSAKNVLKVIKDKQIDYSMPAKQSSVIIGSAACSCDLVDRQSSNLDKHGKHIDQYYIDSYRLNEEYNQWIPIYSPPQSPPPESYV